MKGPVPSSASKNWKKVLSRFAIVVLMTQASGLVMIDTLVKVNRLLTQTTNAKKYYVGLAHARLSINDTSTAGRQPFSDPERKIFCVVNGELYDHDRIRAELIQTCAYKFVSTSDCELAIALYQQYGLSFLDHLRGEFALCLYDTRNQLFLAARDRYGIKPLFWTIQNGRLLVAAEAKAFRGLGWQPQWDVKSLLNGKWNNGECTLFQDVQKVRPGHYLICESGGNVEQRQYWDIDFPNKVSVVPDDC
jgi:asparagine synthase (glutamine-hydrolysing)